MADSSREEVGNLRYDVKLLTAELEALKKEVAILRSVIKNRTGPIPNEPTFINDSMEYR